MNHKITFLLSLLFLGFYFPSNGQAPGPVTGVATLCLTGGTTTLSDATPGGSWSSSTTTIATVDPVTGVVYSAGGSAGGPTVITYTTSGGTATITVIVDPSPVTGLNTLCEGSTITLSDASLGGSWSSTTVTIATISSATGVVTGVSGGTDVINYTTSCGIAYYVITVTPLTTAIISPSTTVCAGYSIYLSDATPGGTWSSGTPARATVTGAGVVWGVTPGAVVISYSNGCNIATFTITVNQTPTSITGVTSFCNGSTALLTCTPAGGVWSSSATPPAAISPTGLVTGSGLGSAVITYTLGDGCYSIAPVVVSNCPPCPPNSDFEYGDYSIWHYYIGSCCVGGAIYTPYAVITPPPVAGPPGYGNVLGCSFALTGPAPAVAPVLVTGVDPWGGFPVVGAGTYSLRVGNTRTVYHAERAEYFVHVPMGTGSYDLIYRYAVVLEAPGHTHATEPKFIVEAYDSATNLIIPCARFHYTADSLFMMPDFFGTVSNTFGTPVNFGCNVFASSALDVYYKPWATTSINLSGLGGHTIRMEFAAGDCGQGGHFGYGYIDMTCGTFAIASTGCGDTVATVSAPSGFSSYLWYDSSTFMILYGTTQTITFTMPPVATTYAVIMAPYAGFGCPDTLYTHIRPSNLQVHPNPDTAICVGQSVTLSSGATDVASMPPLTYSWTPLTGLSCATCATPVVTPFAGVNVYTVLVTDDAGCQKIATQKVTVDSVATTIAYTPTRCYGYTDGTATVTPTSGTGPFVYSWTTVPVQTTSIATNLPIGTYVVTITDSKGCTNTASTTITQPPILTMSIGGTTNPTTCGGSDGTITLNGLGAGPNYTIHYLFTATGTTTTITTVQTYSVSPTGSVVLTGLSQGYYDSITVVTAGCPYNELGPIILSDPPNPALPFVTSNSPVCDSGILNLTTTDVTPGVTYNWVGPNGFTSTSQTPIITPAPFADSGWYVVTVMVNNCFSKDSTKVLINPNPRPAIRDIIPICSGDTLKLVSVTPGGVDVYLWNGPNGFISNQQNPIIINAGAAASGVYTLTVTRNGCTGTDTAIATVNPTPDPPIVLDTNYCQFTTPVPPISAAGTNLLWYTSLPAILSSTVAPTPSTDVAGITTWYVTQTSATTPACTSLPAPLTVGIYKFPDPKFVISDSVYCLGTYFTFNVSDANTGVDFQGITWNFGNGDSIQNVNPIVHAFGVPGPTSVSVNVYYRVCPDATLSHPILVYPYPVLHLGPDTTICPGSEEIIIGDYENSAPLASWIWNTGETTSTIRVVAPGTFYEKVTINGCTTSDTIIVQNDCYMNIPNVFSPNGDGVNDYFYPRQFLTKGLTTFSMNIYNRWGQVVFTSNSIEGRGWDGTFNGVPQPEGVFVYVIDATFKDGQKEHHHGNVTLLR